MQKRWIVFALLSACVCMLAACGKQGNHVRKTETADDTEIRAEISKTDEDGTENVSDVIENTETSSEAEGSLREESAVNEEDAGEESTEGDSLMHENNVEKEETRMVIEVNGQQFEAELYDNDTARALADMLPMTLNMEEMNGNEKYYFMDESLPTETENIGTIQNGDIMLYGSDCLVLFFKTFDTAYSYTRIGHIEDAQGFSAALDSGTVEISFHMN